MYVYEFLAGRENLSLMNIVGQKFIPNLFQLIIAEGVFSIFIQIFHLELDFPREHQPLHPALL